MDFHDRVILVTGASRGIGAAIARAFAAEGGRVAVNYLSNAEAAEAVAAECRTLGGDGWPVQADVGDASAVAAMFEGVEAEFGRIDAVVNNAFLAYAFDPAARTPFWDLDWGDYERQFQGSLRGCFNVCRAAIPAFERRAEAERSSTSRPTSSSGPRSPTTSTPRRRPRWSGSAATSPSSSARGASGSTAWLPGWSTRPRAAATPQRRPWTASPPIRR